MITGKFLSGRNKMNCPECRKELEYIHAYSQCFQKVSIDKNGHTGDWSSPDVLPDDTDFECPHCFENITDSIEII